MKTLKFLLKWGLYFIAFVTLSYLILIVSIRPKIDRNWNLDQKIAPEITLDGGNISIKHIRNFSYETTEKYTHRYYDRTININDIKTAWFMVEPFSQNPGAAHTLVSFGLKDGTYIAVSVEIRKEFGEHFSALKGLLRQYELMYVIADENDVIKLRSNYRHDQVFLYPIDAGEKKIQEMFVDMLTRAQKLQTKPEFYNTLTSTCTTNIVKHLNKISPETVPWDYRILLPGYSDRLAYELGLIKTNLSFEEARKKFNINERAEKYADSVNFSEMIRK